MKLKDLIDLPEKKIKHREDGECGCKYMEENTPCEIEVESYNQAKKEIGELELELDVEKIEQFILDWMQLPEGATHFTVNGKEVHTGYLVARFAQAVADNFKEIIK